MSPASTLVPSGPVTATVLKAGSRFSVKRRVISAGADCTVLPTAGDARSRKACASAGDAATSEDSKATSAMAERSRRVVRGVPAMSPISKNGLAERRRKNVVEEPVELKDEPGRDVRLLACRDHRLQP